VVQAVKARTALTKDRITKWLLMAASFIFFH
jgi:hypothetical protein